jgi:hypothetical protein
LDVVNAIGPVAAVSGSIVGQTNEDKAAPSTNKLPKPTSVPAPHRPAPREKRISKTNATAAPDITSKTVATSEPGRAITEKFFGRRADLTIDAAASPPREVERENDLSPPHDLRTKSAHLARRVLRPIIRTALLLLEPSSLVSREREPQGRTSTDEILSSSRVVQPEPTERTWVPNVFSLRGPETNTPGELR